MKLWQQLGALFAHSSHQRRFGIETKHGTKSKGLSSRGPNRHHRALRDNFRHPAINFSTRVTSGSKFALEEQQSSGYLVHITVAPEDAMGLRRNDRLECPFWVARRTMQVRILICRLPKKLPRQMASSHVQVEIKKGNYLSFIRGV